MDHSDNPLESSQEALEANVEALLNWSDDIATYINRVGYVVNSQADLIADLLEEIITLQGRYQALEDIVTENEMGKVNWKLFEEDSGNDNG
jgi:hypothetical protein